jgi:broad specificity phosphatase PhoE
MLDFNQFKLLLVRHGQSEINATPDMMGQTADSKLTDLGKQQAQRLKFRLEKQFFTFDHIYSSDYVRAMDTAKIVFPSDQGSTMIDSIITTPALREYSAGDWTGANRKQIMTPQVIMKMGYMHNAFLPPNGESMHQVERRASQWLEETILYNTDIQSEAKYRFQKNIKPMNIIVFSHGMTIKCILHYIMGFDQNFTWRLTLENTSITQLAFGEQGWRLISINDHAHLLT